MDKLAQEFHDRLAGKTTVIFLDYDGTLTPIVEDYTKAFLSDAMRAARSAARPSMSRRKDR